MKKLLVAILLMSSFSLTAFAAKYKVNSSGKVTAPSGKVQQKSVLSNGQNQFNLYNHKNYVASKKALSQNVGAIDIVMDYSGSMAFWIGEAKNSMAAIVAQLPSSTNIGFRVFGHDDGNNPYDPVLGKVKNIMQKKNGKYKVSASQASYLGFTSGFCATTKQVAALAPNNATALINGMNSVNIGGATPLTLAMEKAVMSDFVGLSQSEPKKIILITDGGESCGGDPCGFARNLARTRKDIVIDVLLVDSSGTELKCMSDYTGGKFYTPNDVSSFSSSLYDAMSAPATETQQKQKYEFISF